MQVYRAWLHRSSVGVRRAFSLPLRSPLPPSIASLLFTFRLLVNLAIREALGRNLTARGSLTSLAQQTARDSRINFHHARRASDVALAIVHGYRRRERHRIASPAPYLHRPFLLATRQTLHLDPLSGKVRLSLRSGEWASFFLPLADYHRQILSDPHVRVKELSLSSTRVSVIYEKEVPEPYLPTSLLALDTNESSLDGVRVTPLQTTAITVPFPQVRVLQQRGFERRRRLARKKAHDRRVARRLLAGVGRRERQRVVQRLHRVSKRLVEVAQRERAAVVLERLESLPVLRRRSPRTRRRLSSWPRRELHRQILYKAEDRGVPVFHVNPRYTSRTCPRCGVIQGRRSRVGTRFSCEECGWTLDRQVNAGVNLAQTVLAETRELGGLRVDLDALLEDAMRLLYATE